MRISCLHLTCGRDKDWAKMRSRGSADAFWARKPINSTGEEMSWSQGVKEIQIICLGERSSRVTLESAGDGD